MRNERNDRQAMLRLSNIERMEIISLAVGKTHASQGLRIEVILIDSLIIIL